MNDQELEEKIEQAKHRFLFSRTIEDRRKYQDEFFALIRQRSPEQVSKMEKERGLS